ncbi:acyl-CoA synthetase [Nocardia sp. NBC_00403]|uniref:acyl-CoA synthetase n=1 Tax=Nocardia sp. NBC_00403 TaxID=2975990 RepID=UPI002E214C8B
MYSTHALHRALQQTPDLPMTVSGSRTRTVRESFERISRLAGAFREIGVRPGDRVAILALNSDRYHEIFFATWWCGAVVNPINIRWSPAEITGALRDAQPSLLLADDSRLSLVTELTAGALTGVYCGDGSPAHDMLGYEDLVANTKPVPDLRTGEDAPASLLYTGGTTGSAKGVLMTHRNLMTSAVSHETAQAGGVSLLTAPMFHIAALSCWLTQNYHGGTVVFLPSFEPGSVLAAIEKYRVTSVTLVPTMLGMLLDHPDLGSFDTSSLWALGYGAAPMPATLLERARRALPGAGFVQGYGTTETAIVTALTRKDHEVGGTRLRSAGRVAAHCEVRIATGDGSEAPRGEVGELLVRGDGCMREYWRQPEQTAAVLRDGWLHTGDAAYMDDDGFVYIVDRLTDMIITGGENVYSSEVENALATHPAVAACAVIGLPDQRWGERVHAVVVLAPGARATEAELRTHAAASIARYKVPRAIDFVAAMPLSAAGKVLKSLLRDQLVRG